MWAFVLFLFGLGLILAIVAPINKRRNARCSAKTQGILTQILLRHRSLIYVYSYFAYEGREYIYSTMYMSEEDYCMLVFTRGQN